MMDYYNSRQIPRNYKEITFEQFNEYVLKKNIERKPFKLNRH